VEDQLSVKVRLVQLIINGEGKPSLMEVSLYGDSAILILIGLFSSNLLLRNRSLHTLCFPWGERQAL